MLKNRKILNRIANKLKRFFPKNVIIFKIQRRMPSESGQAPPIDNERSVLAVRWNCEAFAAMEHCKIKEEWQ